MFDLKISKRFEPNLATLGQSTITENTTTNRSLWVEKKDLFGNIPGKLWHMKQVSQVMNIKGVNNSDKYKENYKI